jgi:hypothetical protein
VSLEEDSQDEFCRRNTRRRRAVLAAAGYNFRRILAWLALLLSAILSLLVTLARAKTNAKPVHA